MAKNDLAELVQDLTDQSLATIKKAIRSMDADDVINLKSAVDDQDSDLVSELLSKAQPDDQPEKLSVKDTRMEINRRGRKNIDDDQPMDDVWELVASLSNSDWKLIWPAVDAEVLAALYQEATDRTTKTISSRQSSEIYDHGQEFVAESMVVYANQLVEVSVPRGPNRTVGVIVNGQTRMVGRSEISRLTEHVITMVQMPSLGRLQQLAGVAHSPAAPPAASYDPTSHPKFKQAQRDLVQLQRAISEIQLGMNQCNWEQALDGCDQAAHQLAVVQSMLDQILQQHDHTQS